MEEGEKKLRVVLIAVLLVVITGCSSVNVHQTETSSPPYEIIWYHINAPQKDTLEVFNEVNKYIKPKINAHVTIKMVDWNEYDNVMKAVIASGEKYDICFTSSWANDYFENANKGSFREVSSLLDKHGHKIVETSNKILLDGTKIKGKNYAIPCKQEIGHQFALIFNHKYVEKYGFDISRISKLEDIEPMLNIIKENEPDVIPYAITGGFNHSLALPFDRIIENIPGSLYYDNRTQYKVTNEIETLEYKNYLSIMHRWNRLGYIAEDAPYMGVSISNFEKEGNWFASITSNVPHGDIILSTRCGYKIDVIPLHKPIIKNRDLSGSMLAISSISSNPEIAMKFIDLLHSDKYLYNLVTYGIEGKHYIKNSDGTISYPEGKTQFNCDYGMAPFTTGNLMLTYILKDYPLTYLDDYENFNSIGIKSPLIGFWFDPSNVKNEIASLSSISSEFLPALNTGAIDPEVYLPVFISKLNDAGLQKVLDEEQKQLKEWMGETNAD